MTKLQISVVILSICGLVLTFPSAKFERDAEELAGMFEGDLDLTEEQKEELFSQSRNGLIDTRYRWPSKTVAYSFSPTDFSQAQKNAIREALDEIEKVSCIKFVPRITERDYIFIKGNTSGCNSRVGRVGGAQNLNLNAIYEVGKGCFRKFTIVHEFFHALGFYHMQSNFNRDDYVKIVFENIEPGHEDNFKKYEYNKVTDFGVPYDYASVLHYHRTAFSIDGKSATIIPTYNKTAVIGQRDKISERDILKLKLMYGCP